MLKYLKIDDFIKPTQKYSFIKQSVLPKKFYS